MGTNGKQQAKYVPPSRAGKHNITSHVDSEVVEAYNAAKKLLGMTKERLGFVALRLLFQHLGQAVPPSIERMLRDTTPKRRGPLPGHGGRPRKNLGD